MSAPRQTMRQDRLWPILVVSGALGALCGGLLEPTWQDVIEPAQVLAGVVRYDPNLPLYLYSTHTWTILHQVTAVLIAGGVAEWWLAISWSALIGALSFQALSLITRAMGAPAAIAALGPLLIWGSGMTLLPTSYATPLLGWRGTYGMVANPFLLLVIGLFATGRFKAGAFAVGVLPGIHVAMGVWCWILLAVLVALHPARWRERLRPVAPWWIAGMSITLVSAAVHYTWFVGPAPEVTQLAQSILRAIRDYDSHRGPLRWGSLTQLGLIALPFVFLWLQHRWGTVAPNARVIAQAFAVALGLRLAADAVIRLTPEWIGHWIERPMPGRLLTLCSLGASAWLVGAVTARQSPPAVRLLGAASFTVIGVTTWVALALPDSRLAAALYLPETWLLRWPAVAATMLGILGAIVVVATTLPARLQDACAKWATVAPRALLVTLVGITMTVGVQGAWNGRDNLRRLVSPSTDPVYSQIAARPGLLLTAGHFHLVQGPSRRPVLLDYAALDFLIYVPTAAVAVNRILEVVYGRPLVPTDGSTPDEVGSIDEEEVTLDLWQGRSLAEWQAIRSEFGVTDVLTPIEWRLRLPLLASNASEALWEIPAAPAR